MSSERKIEANRRNAQRSTGPKTPEGKAKVATNSCTHGLCSRNAVLPEEDPGDFQTLLDGLRDVFQPANAFEDSNVRELACAEWRLRRALRIETGILVYGMERARQTERCPVTAPRPARSPEEIRYDQETRLLGISFYRNCETDSLTKLTRYENSIRRAYYKALKELKSPPPPRHTNLTKQTQIPPPESPPPPPDPPLEDTYAQQSTEPPSPWPLPAARLAPPARLCHPRQACGTGIQPVRDLHHAPLPLGVAVHVFQVRFEVPAQLARDAPVVLEHQLPIRQVQPRLDLDRQPLQRLLDAGVAQRIVDEHQASAAMAPAEHVALQAGTVRGSRIDYPQQTDLLARLITQRQRIGLRMRVFAVRGRRAVQQDVPALRVVHGQHALTDAAVEFEQGVGDPLAAHEIGGEVLGHVRQG
jgi:hypothetical protein